MKRDIQDYLAQEKELEEMQQKMVEEQQQEEDYLDPQLQMKEGLDFQEQTEKLLSVDLEKFLDEANQAEKQEEEEEPQAEAAPSPSSPPPASSEEVHGGSAAHDGSGDAAVGHSPDQHPVVIHAPIGWLNWYPLALPSRL